MWRSLSCVLALIVAAGPAQADNWPAWRGPRGDGISTESTAPVRWSPNENITWKVEIPGKGHSSPVVWNDRIFVTTCLEKERKRLLLCLDRRSGKILWEREVLTAPLEKIHRLNSYASSTPATDGKHVWVSFLDMPKVQAACYDFDGNQVWMRSPGMFQPVHGFCSPPVPYKDTIILNCDQDDPQAFLVCLDKKTGAERWRVSRPGVRSYCTPLLVEAAGKMQLVLSGSNCITSYDPDSGKPWWFIDGPTEQFVASMVFHDNLFFMSAGFPTYHIMGIKPDGTGNVTKTHVAWHVSKQTKSYVPSPVAHNKCFFMVNDNGTATCWDSASGKNLWTESLGRHHSASPVSCGGLIYFLDDAGMTYVLKGGGKFELVSKNPLGDEAYASPAISDGQLFIRTLHYLFCIGPAKKAT